MNGLQHGFSGCLNPTSPHLHLHVISSVSTLLQSVPPLRKPDHATTGFDVRVGRPARWKRYTITEGKEDSVVHWSSSEGGGKEKRTRLGSLRSGTLRGARAQDAHKKNKRKQEAKGKEKPARDIPKICARTPGAAGPHAYTQMYIRYGAYSPLDSSI